MSKSLNENPLWRLHSDEPFENGPKLEEGPQRPQNTIQTDKEPSNTRVEAAELHKDSVPNDAIADSAEGSPFQQECALNSKIWQLYQEKARTVDEHLKESHNSGLDSLLIFGGLFSAILAAFIIEARKGLQPDQQAITNALLQDLLQFQRGFSPTYNLPSFKPSPSLKIINGLWFCSLSFSLLSTLGASLAKGWVADYAQVQHKPNAEDAYRRHLRFVGISSWHLTDVITSLPILLHIAFFLFAFGLSILLFGDSKLIGAITLVLTVVALILYLGTAALPVIHPDCPYQTPVTTFLIRLVGCLFKREKYIPKLSGISKAQLLLWLHDISFGSAEMDQIIISIAGLDPLPDVQCVLHTSRFARTLCVGLSAVNMQLPNLQLLKAYLYAILHLLRTGFPHFGDADEPTTKKLLVRLITQGGPLYDCGSLPVDVQEIAGCVKARILLRYDVPKDQIFKISIPLLLQSATQEAHQKMLREVQLLSLSVNHKLLLQLHSDDEALRLNAYNQMEEIARERSTIDIGYGLITDGINSPISSLFIKYLEAFNRISAKDSAAGWAILPKIDMERMTHRLEDPKVCNEVLKFMTSIGKTDIIVTLVFNNFVEGLVKKLQCSDRDVKKLAINCIKTLCAHDDIRTEFVLIGGVETVIGKFQDSGSTVKKSALDCMKTLCAHDNIRTKFVSNDGIEKLIGNLQDFGPSALECIMTLCVHDDIRNQFTSNGGIERLVRRFQATEPLVQTSALNCINAICINVDIRTKFLAKGGMEKLITAFQDSNSSVRRSALHSIKTLCKHDDIRTKFNLNDGIEKLIRRFHDSDWAVQMSVLDSIHALCIHDDTRTQFISIDGIDSLITKLQDLNWIVRGSALDCIKTLCVHYDIRTQFISNGGIEKLIGRFQDSRPLVRMSALNCINTICVNDDIKTKFVANGGIGKLIGRFQDSASPVRRSALNCIEVFCTYSDIRTHFISNGGIEKLIRRFHDYKPLVQMSALDCINTICVNDDIRTEFVAIGGIGKVIGIFQDSNSTVQKSALRCIRTLCTHDTIRSRFSSNGGIEELFGTLQDSEPTVRRSALHCIRALSEHDDMRTQFILDDGISKLIGKFQDSDWAVQISALNCMKTLCIHSDIRNQLISNGGVEKLIGRCQDPEPLVRMSTLNCINTISLDDDIRAKFVVNGGIEKLILTFRDHDSTVRGLAVQCIKTLCEHDDIRTKFVLNHGIESLIGKFQDFDPIVRMSTLDWIKTLCTHDDIRRKFISIDGIEKLIGKLQDSNSNVRYSALDCIMAICVHGDSSSQFIANHGIENLIEKLRDPDSLVRTSALRCIDALCAHAQILDVVSSRPNLLLVTQTLNSQDGDSQTKEFLAFVLAKSLASKENLALVRDGLRAVSRLLKTANSSKYGLLILEHISKNHMELINKSEIRDTLHAMLLDVDDIDRITAVEGLLILKWL